jgi:hypothetical protein
MALLTVMQINVSSIELIAQLRTAFVDLINPIDKRGQTIVFVNGEIIGSVKNNVEDFCNMVRVLKYRNVIPYLTR